MRDGRATDVGRALLFDEDDVHRLKEDEGDADYLEWILENNAKIRVQTAAVQSDPIPRALSGTNPASKPGRRRLILTARRPRSWALTMFCRPNRNRCEDCMPVIA